MRGLLRLSVIVVALGGTPAWAGIGDALPGNTCPGAAKFKSNLGVLDVSGDGSLGNGCTNGPFSETVISCTSKEGAGKNIDVRIEYFDAAGGAPIGSGNVCGVAPGATLTFHTVPPASQLPGAWNAPGATPGFISTTAVTPNAPCAFGTTGCFLHGTARVLSTSKKVHCTATRLDLVAPCFGPAPGPNAIKSLTIINKAKQAGD